jgi:hypothetical protein
MNMRSVNRARVDKPLSLSGDALLDARRKIGAHYSLDAPERSRRRADFDSSIWNSLDVVEALSLVFLRKCAFCEMAADGPSTATVEHFRPLANARTGRRSDNPDHYGWFAYEWRNLYLLCKACSAAKANLFPVEGPRGSILCSWEEAQATERRLLLDPCEDDPTKHLDVAPDGTLGGRTDAGAETIATLNLNRDELVADRTFKLARCRGMLTAAKAGVERAFDQFLRELDPEQTFSGSALIFFLVRFKRAAKAAGIRAPRASSYAQDFRVYLAALPDDIWGTIVDEPQAMSSPSYDLVASYSREVTVAQSAEDSSWRLHASAQIRHVRLTNFKGVEDLALDFRPTSSGESGASCTMLLGENSTGKSSILQAIALTLMGSAQRKRLKLDPVEYLTREPSGWELTGLRRAEVYIEFDIIDPVRLTIDPAEPAFEGETDPTMPVLAYGARRFFGKPARRADPVAKVRTLFSTLAHLEYQGIWLQELGAQEFDAVARAMRDILSLQPDDRIERDAEGQIRVHAHGRATPLEQLSDGYRSLFAMSIDIMREMIEKWGNLESARGLVLIDELEVHLHPRWKMKVVDALRQAMPNVQLIATTHDPLCLRGMKDGEVHVLVRNEGAQIEEVKDLPNVRGLRAEQLLTSDYFGLFSTAEPEVEGDLEHLALSASSGDSAGVTNSISNLLPFRMIGDTDLEQVVNEALRRYLEERRLATISNRSQLRDDAISDVIEALRNMKFTH